MENRKALLPLCSGVLGVISLILQIIAIATPYWAHFSSEDPLGTGTRPIGEGHAFESGHYGLWTLCVEIYEGRRLQNEVCDLLKPIFEAGNLRTLAGVLAIVNAILLVVFVAPIPAQLCYLLREKGIVGVRYTSLTICKILAIIFGAICGVLAAVLVGIHSKTYYKIPKGWSFAFQIVVVILQVFLLICSATEHLIGRKFPRIPLNQIKRKEMTSNNNESNDGLSNLAFASLSPDSLDKGSKQKYNQPSISVTPQSGTPYRLSDNSLDKETEQQPPRMKNGKTVRMFGDELLEPRNRNSMQYLEEVPDPVPEPLPARKPVVKDPSKHRRNYYKNNAYNRGSRDSDLDASNPSISSRNGSQNKYTSPSMSSDTVSSFTKSTDV